MTRILCVGHSVEDHIFHVKNMPTTPTKHQANGLSIVGGGPAANAAVTIARLGGKALLASRVGMDDVGSSIINDLENEHVDCSLVRQYEGVQSSVSAVMVDETGQRMIVNHLDTDLPANPDWLNGLFPEDLGAVLADTRWPEGATLALSIARDRGIPAVLDADYPIPKDSAFLSCATHLAFSAEGLRACSGIEDIATAVIAMAENFGVWACVTNGEKGVFSADSQGVHHVPAFAVTPVDTTAAGDVWHGAFAYALACGESNYKAIFFANAAAAIKVTRAGGRQGAPTLGEVQTFMRQQLEECRA